MSGLFRGRGNDERAPLVSTRDGDAHSGDSLNDEESSASDRPRSSSDSREDGSSSNNSGDGDGNDARGLQTNPNFKTASGNSLTNSSGSSIASNSQHTSVEDVSGGELDASAKSSNLLPRPIRREQVQKDANCSSEFTTEYASSTTSGGVSSGEIRRHVYSVPRGTKRSRSSESLSDFFRNNGVDLKGEAEEQAKQRRFSSDNNDFRGKSSSSGSDVDAIIRRAKEAMKSTCSSSSSEELSFFHTLKGQNDKLDVEGVSDLLREHKRSKNDSPSLSNCPNTSSSSGDPGSLNTSCLDGIASDSNLGDGGFSSSDSRAELLGKNSYSSSSDRDNRETATLEKVDDCQQDAGSTSGSSRDNERMFQDQIAHQVDQGRHTEDLTEDYTRMQESVAPKPSLPIKPITSYEGRSNENHEGLSNNGLASFQGIVVQGKIVHDAELGRTNGDKTEACARVQENGTHVASPPISRPEKRTEGKPEDDDKVRENGTQTLSPMQVPRITDYAVPPNNNFAQINLAPILNTSYLSSNQVQHMLPIYLDYSLLKRMDEKLTKSQESLQMLKEWDKGMGLKSSHSKTMTQSARSRKKLHNKIKRLLKKLESVENK